MAEAKKKLTPDEFAKKMREIRAEFYEATRDVEGVHYAMDVCMCEVLTALGYGEGVEVFKDTPGWYA